MKKHLCLVVASVFSLLVTSPAVGSEVCVEGEFVIHLNDWIVPTSATTSVTATKGRAIFSFDLQFDPASGRGELNSTLQNPRETLFFDDGTDYPVSDFFYDDEGVVLGRVNTKLRQGIQLGAEEILIGVNDEGQIHRFEYFGFSLGQQLKVTSQKVCSGETNIENSVSGAQSDLRVIRLLVAADDSFIGYSSEKTWKSFVTRTIESASKAFERELGIQLDVAEFKGVALQSKTGLEAIKELETSFPATTLNQHDIDAVLVFVDTYSESSHATLGATTRFGRYALIGKGNILDVPGTIVHELAHVFGAVHVDDPSSIMFSSAVEINMQNFTGSLSRSIQFDEGNRDIVLLMKKHFDFQEGVLTLPSDVVVAYSEMAAKLGDDRPNRITEMYFYAGVGARSRGDLKYAQTCFEKIVEVAPSCSNHRQLGDLFFYFIKDVGQAEKQYRLAFASEDDSARCKDFVATHRLPLVSD